MRKASDPAFVFAMIGLMPITLIFLFKRSWLNDQSISRRVERVCLFAAALGVTALALLPRHLEFVFFLIPIYQVLVHKILLRRFHRKYRRDPFFPPRFSLKPAHFPDFTFNTIFLLLTTAAMMPVLGIVFAQLKHTSNQAMERTATRRAFAFSVVSAPPPKQCALSVAVASYSR